MYGVKKELQHIIIIRVSQAENHKIETEDACTWNCISQTRRDATA